MGFTSHNSCLSVHACYTQDQIEQTNIIPEIVVPIVRERFEPLSTPENAWRERKKTEGRFGMNIQHPDYILSTLAYSREAMRISEHEDSGEARNKEPVRKLSSLFLLMLIDEPLIERVMTK